MQNEEQNTVPAPEPPASEHPVPETPVSDNIKPARKAYSRSQLNLAIFYVIYFVIAIIVVHFLPENYSEKVEYLAHYIPMYLIAFPLYLLISFSSVSAASWDSLSHLNIEVFSKTSLS